MLTLTIWGTIWGMDMRRGLPNFDSPPNILNYTDFAIAIAKSMTSEGATDVHLKAKLHFSFKFIEMHISGCITRHATQIDIDSRFVVNAVAYAHEWIDKEA